MSISSERLEALQKMTHTNLLHEAHEQHLEFTECLFKEVVSHLPMAGLEWADFKDCTSLDQALNRVFGGYQDEFLLQCVIAWESNETAQATGAPSRFKSPDHVRSVSAVGVAIMTHILSA